MCVAVCPWPVRHTYPACVGEFPQSLIKLERAGISADIRETTRTKMAQVHGLDSKIIVLWSSRIYLRLVHSLIFSVDAFSGWFTNMLNLEIFFGFIMLITYWINSLLTIRVYSCTCIADWSPWKIWHLVERTCFVQFLIDSQQTCKCIITFCFNCLP